MAICRVSSRSEEQDGLSDEMTVHGSKRSFKGLTSLKSSRHDTGA